MNPRRILIVEDDQIQNDVLANFLRKDGDEVVSAYSLKEAEVLFAPDIALVVLDVMLPDGNGIDFLRSIRRISNVPVIMLTALDDDYTKIQTFDLKADEYVDKPVSPQVMTRRIHAFLDRIYGTRQETCLFGFRFDFQKYMVTDEAGLEIKMTRKEMDIIRFLMDNHGQIVSRDSLITNLWGCDYESEERAIDTHIKNIRKKLHPELILTVKGVGYRLNM
ncbi:MAG: response regulator transcription factor [Clostridiales bacterium]|nr:response regulator transcription factor [Clostridiales bacterium]